MVDVVSSEARSRMMSGIRAKDTKPELVVRKALHAAGFRFRLHRRDLPGVPDVVLPKWKVAIFTHGCFWHLHKGCRNSRLPASRTEFWEKKLMRNVERDRDNIEALLVAGWRVLVVWECATRDKAISDGLPSLLAKWIDTGEVIGEFPLVSSAT